VIAGVSGLLRRRTHEFLELSIPGDRFSFVFDRFMMVLILLNVAAIVLETVPSIHAAYQAFFFNFEVFSVAIFTVEYLLRIWSCTEDKANNYSHPIIGRIKYMASPMAIIDLVLFCPSISAPSSPSICACSEFSGCCACSS